jgi:hypothetical protein
VTGGTFPGVLGATFIPVGPRLVEAPGNGCPVGGAAGRVMGNGPGICDCGKVTGGRPFIGALPGGTAAPGMAFAIEDRLSASTNAGGIGGTMNPPIS